MTLFELTYILIVFFVTDPLKLMRETLKYTVAAARDPEAY